jgi:hypothetical protein
MWLVVPLWLAVGVGWFVRTWYPALPGWVETALVGRWSAAALGLVSALIALWVWGSVTEPGVIHDEQAYVLQAEIFSTGRWTGEAPPLPEFFEQAHVFVEPRLAAKYPPVNSLAMVPGMWLGMPGFMPLVFVGIAGGLLFVLVREHFGAAAALLVWALWSTSSVGLFWRASFLSQNLSTALWFFALWAFSRWRQRPSVVCFSAIAIAFGLMFLTRPFTAPALALPIGILVLPTVRKCRPWRYISLGACILVAVALVNVLWHQKTLGDWWTSPYAEYSRQYFPFVKPGFGADGTAPQRIPTPEIQWLGDAFIDLHRAHRPETLPSALRDRAGVLLLSLAETWRAFLIVLFVVGCATVRGPGVFAGVSFLVLLLGYLIYAHPAAWTVYYAEVFAVFFVIAIAGLIRIWKRHLGMSAVQLRAALLLFLLVCVPGMVDDVRRAKDARDARSAFQRQALRLINSIPEESAIVFTRYPPDHEHHDSLTLNTPDYRTSRLWLVNDRGADNDRLLAVTERPAYRLHVGDWTLERLR